MGRLPLHGATVVDPHVHLCKYGREKQTFAQVADALLVSMREHHVAVSFVCPDSERGTSVADMETYLALAEGRSGLRVYGTAQLPGAEPELLGRLEALAREGAIIGLKLYPGFEPVYPSDPTCHALYELAQRYGLPVLLHSGETMGETWREKYNSPAETAALAARFPALSVIVAYFGQPHIAECREVLLAYENVYADVSGLADQGVMAACGTEAIASVLREVTLRRPEKVLFATDWPLCSVRDHMRLIESLNLSPGARELLLGGNAVRLFGL